MYPFFQGQLSSHLHSHLKKTLSSLIKVHPRTSTMALKTSLGEKGRPVSASEDAVPRILSLGNSCFISLPSRHGPLRVGREKGRRMLLPYCSGPSTDEESFFAFLTAQSRKGWSFQTLLCWSLGTRKARKAPQNNCFWLTPSASAHIAFEKAVLFFPEELENCCGPSCICNLMEIEILKSE